jgi:hypothetical protein
VAVALAAVVEAEAEVEVAEVPQQKYPIPFAPS